MMYFQSVNYKRVVIELLLIIFASSSADKCVEESQF